MLSARTAVGLNADKAVANFEVSDSYQNSENRKQAQAKLDELKARAKQMKKYVIKSGELSRRVTKEFYIKK